MDMMPITSVMEPVHEFTANAPWQPLKQEAAWNGTSFVTLPEGMPWLRSTSLGTTGGALTRTGHDEPSVAALGRHSAPRAQPEPQRSPIDLVASERVKLLAAKYASDDASRELLARLEVLSGKLRAMAPTVEPSQVAFLESVHRVLEDGQRQSEERARRRQAALRG